MQNMAKTHAHKIACARTHARMHTHTHTHFANCFALLQWNAFRSAFLCVLTVPCYSEKHSDQPFYVFWLFALLQWKAFRSAFLCVLTICPVTVKSIQISLSMCSDCLPCYSEKHSDQPFYVFWLFALLQWKAFRSAFLCVLTVCLVTMNCVFWLFALLQWNAFRSTILCAFPLAVGRSSWRRNRRGRLWRTLRRDTTTSWSWRTLYESCTICLWTWPCLWRVRWDHSLEWAHWVGCFFVHLLSVHGSETSFLSVHGSETSLGEPTGCVFFSSFSLFMGVKPPSSLFMGVKPQSGWAQWAFPPSSVFMGVKPQSGWAHWVFPPSSLFMGVKQQSGWAHWVFSPSTLFMGELENSVRELCDMVVDMVMLVESLMMQQSKWTDFSASSSSFRGVLDNCRRALQFVCGHFLQMLSGEF